MRRITQEQKEMIYALWDAGVTFYSDISKEVGVSDVTVKKIIKARNEADTKICPKCKHESRSDARFCYYCGNDLRSREELLAIKVEKLRSMILHLPENMRGEFDETTREIMRYLKEKGGIRWLM